MIRCGEGDLLAAAVDALVNPVNCVGVMGKGLARQFRDAWPAMFRAYATACASGEVVPGRMHVWATGEAQPRFVVNFPTKRHFRSRSRLLDVDAGLEDLVRVVCEREVRSLAVPALGAGLGGLDWSEVRPRIVRALEPLDADVWLFEPR